MSRLRALVDAAAAAHANALEDPRAPLARTAHLLLAAAEACEQSGAPTGLDLPVPRSDASVCEWAEKTLTVAQRLYAHVLRVAEHGVDQHSAAGCDRCQRARATVRVLMRRGVSGYRCTACVREQFDAIYQAGGVTVGICETSGGPEWDTTTERDMDRGAL